MDRFSYTKGFTLAEMIVSVGLFSVVMFIATGALLSIVSLNKKAQAQQSVMNNMASVMENMVRNIRTGTGYHCVLSSTSEVWDGVSNDSVVPQVCTIAEAGYLLAFKPDVDGVMAFKFDSVNGTILKFYKNASGVILINWIPITAPEIKISKVKFINGGSLPLSSGDTFQATVRVSISGSAFVDELNVASPRKVNFFLQTRALMRNLDL